MVAYFDGRRAKRHDARAEIHPAGLKIISSTVVEPVVWPYETIKLIAREGKGGPWTLGSSISPRARLRLDNVQIFEALARRRPELADARPRARGLISGLTIGGIAAAVVGILLFALPYLVGPVMAVIPVASERQFGRHVYQQLAELLHNDGLDGGVCSGSHGVAVIDRMVATFRQSFDGDYDYQVTVLDISDINAFAAPGGWILIGRGLIDQAETPDELAAVIAHEMAHVDRRHGLKRIITSQGRSILLSMMGVGLGGSAAEAGAMAMLDASNSRAQESEADDLAIDLLVEHGISTAGMANFFTRLTAAVGDHEGSYLAGHPANSERAANALAADLGFDPILNDEDWHAVRNICS